MIVLWLLACKHPLPCTATTLEKEPVVQVNWSGTDGPSHVEYGTSADALTMSTATDDGGSEHSFDLFGMPSVTDVFYRGVTDDGKVERTCEGSLQTPNLVPGLPQLLVTTDTTSLESTEPFVLGSVLPFDQPVSQATFIINRQGQWVWYDNAVATAMPPTERPQTIFAPDGQGLLANQFPFDRANGADDVQRWSLEDEVLDTRPTPGAHHVFVELPDGGLAYPAIDVRSWHDPDVDADIPVVGDDLIELHTDGTTRVVWSSWDGDFPVEKSQEWESNFYPQGKDWTHANSLYYYADTDTYLLSLGHLETIVEISRSTGKATRSFGKDGTYKFGPDAIEFWLQHDAHWIDAAHTQLLVFATLANPDPTQPPPPAPSGAIEYSVDDAKHEINTVWNYGIEPDLGIDSLALGQADRLSNGNTFVNWGEKGIIREVTPDGTVAWELTIASGSFFGQVYLVDGFPAQ